MAHAVKLLNCAQKKKSPGAPAGERKEKSPPPPPPLTRMRTRKNTAGLRARLRIYNTNDLNKVGAHSRSPQNGRQEGSHLLRVFGVVQ